MPDNAPEPPASDIAASRRQPLLEGKEAPAPPLVKSIVTGAPKVRPAAHATAPAGPRWSHLLGISLLQLVLLGGVFSFLNTKPAPIASQSIVPAPALPAVDTSAFESALKSAQKEISALQAQIDSQSREKERTQARLQEMADRMALLLQQGSLTGVGGGARGGSGDTAAEVAAMLPSVTPATAELILIKERNRLSDYADRAIAEGSRADLESLVKAMLDPDLKNLAHAARAEFKRVQAWYEIATSIDPGYTLPVQELFKDSGAIREADLTTAQLHTLLLDQKQPWEARLRAAFLLRASNEAMTTTLLLQAIKEDPVLDVAKQAQISFENRVGRKFRMFDIPAIEAWWQSQGIPGTESSRPPAQ